MVIPDHAPPTACNGDWCVYEFKILLIAIYNDISTGQLGLLVLFPDYAGTAPELAADLSDANPILENLSETFNWPNGNTISYDPRGGKRDMGY